ncbi:T9SS type A sorting domain-containing protein [Epilithonimonas sp.]|uniref:T9SS type A sorting domain-containing protein n=1 Tax=Epilithonimonas sp. TaxID=2894511 RepID=UPI00289FE5FF|nr:T9SS type A sorting domain-containing protein [Epilithonimonas sp.]
MKRLLLFVLTVVMISVQAQKQQIYFTTFPQANPPSGWEREILLGEYNWYYGEMVLPGSTLFSKPAAVFNDDITGEEGNQATLTSPSWNVAGYDTVWLTYEYGLNRANEGGTLAVEVFNGSSWQQVAFYDQNQAPITIEPINVTAYKNESFKVRFTFDDEYTYSMGAGITNFLIEGTASVAPNSECWNAVLLNCGATGGGSTVNATIKDELAPFGTLNPNGSHGVWYKYSDIGNQSNVTFSLCDTTAVFDSKIIVYQGACADLFPIAGNDDTCGTLSEVTFHNDGSSTYYILVFGAEESTSNFSYKFNCLSNAPANDDIENAIDVNLFEQPYTDPAVSLIEATVEADTADFLETGCDMSGGWYPNVFYKFTAEKNGTATATFKTPNEGGFQLIAFYSAPNKNAAIKDLSFVVQSTSGCNQMSETKSIDITAGTTYYVVMMSPYTNSDIVIDLQYETMAVDENKLSKTIIAPNPVKDIVNLNSKSTINKVEVFDLAGKLVYNNTIGKQQTQLNLSFLAKGAYIMKLKTDKNTETFKIIKK